VGILTKLTEEDALSDTCSSTPRMLSSLNLSRWKLKWDSG